MARGANTDWISNLPPEIIEKILTLLPIRNAIRTSILSRTWRYKWTSMPDLNFGREPWSNAEKLLKGINQCLLLHQGAIRKFTVCSMTLTLRRNIDSLMRIVLKQDIEELEVQLRRSTSEDYYRFPSCLFDCKKLTHLELSSCKLYVPPTFEGFLNLKILKLAIMVVDTNIERIISKSPLLENLTLCALCGPNDAITISAPKVEYLFLHGQFKDICLENTPTLLEISLSLEPNVAMTGQGGCNLVKVFSGAPNLEKLTVRCWFEYFKLGYYPGAIPATFNYLKVMNVSSVNLEDRDEILLLLEMLTSAPNLVKLILRPMRSRVASHIVDYDSCMKEYPLQRGGFMKLKVIELTDVSCMPAEIEFAKFMLGNSPVLEKMKIASMIGKKVTASGMFRKLRKLPRASDRAEVKFSHKWRDIKI